MRIKAYSKQGPQLQAAQMQPAPEKERGECGAVATNNEIFKAVMQLSVKRIRNKTGSRKANKRFAKPRQVSDEGGGQYGRGVVAQLRYGMCLMYVCLPEYMCVCVCEWVGVNTLDGDVAAAWNEVFACC